MAINCLIYIANWLPNKKSAQIPDEPHNLTKKAQHNLVEHLTDPHWREILLFSTGLSSKGNHLLPLMKNKADELIQDDRLIDLISWARDKADLAGLKYKPAAVRSFYVFLAFSHALALDLACNLDKAFVRYHALNRIHAISRVLDRTLDFRLNIDFALIIAHSLALDLAHSPGLEHALALGSDLSRVINLVIAHADEIKSDSLIKSLKYLNKIPAPNSAEEERLYWCEKLRTIMIQERDVGHEFELNKKQVGCLEDYLYANLLIVECLNCSDYISASVRQEIENGLLLPGSI